MIEMVNIDKIYALKVALVVLGVIGCSFFLLNFFAVDVLGFRVEAYVAKMKMVSDILCDERIRSGEYPEQQEAVAANLKRYCHIKSFTYTRQNKDTFELNVVVSNILRDDAFFRVNTDGVYYKDGDRGEWHRWFANECKEKIENDKKSSNYFDKLKNQPGGPQRRAKCGA